MTRWALPAALVLVLAGCGSTNPHLIAFTTTRDGNAEVYVMDADGSNAVDVSQNLAQDGEPSWAPDGKKIAFVSVRSGNAQIYVMNSNGTGVKRLTRVPTSDMSPVWSPDGRRIAFMCTTATPRLVTEICVVGADGTGERRLTSPAERDSLYPQWSPDSTKILYTSMRNGTSVREVDATTGREEPFLTDALGDAEATYSPDGTQIAFLEHKFTWVLDVIAADLRGKRVVVQGDSGADSPAWSSDGMQVAYSVGGVIYVVNADGTNRVRMTYGKGASLSPRWSADGKQIAFERVSGQHSDVYVMRADGMEETNVTGGHGKSGGPAWQP